MFNARGGVAPLHLVLLTALVGCRHPEPRPEPPNALKELEKKLRPAGSARPAPSAPNGDQTARLRQVEEAIRALVKEIDADNADRARGALMTDQDLEAVVLEGFRPILSSSLLPENRKNLDALLDAARGLDVAFGQWTPGRLDLTRPGGNYREGLPMVRLGKLELAVGGQTRQFEVDLVYVHESWKLFQLKVEDPTSRSR